jgi:hypothetical protein
MSEATRGGQAERPLGFEEEKRAEVTESDDGRGRRRSKTMSRKEIARDLRRQRALGLVDT